VILIRSAKPQDYLSSFGDPVVVGKTAQEKSPAWLRHCGGFVFIPGQELALAGIKSKTPLLLMQKRGSLVARPRIELGTS